MATLAFMVANKSSEVLKNMFGDNLKNQIAVTDRHSAYFKLDFKNHQVRLVHILRELEYLTELDTKQEWSGKIAKLLQSAIHSRNQHLKEIFDTKEWLSKLDHLLEKDVSKWKTPFRRLRNSLIKCRDYLFNFLKDPFISSDNNASERGIRPLKLKQKISGYFRSELGAEVFHNIYSVIDTAKKFEQSKLRALYDL